MSDIVQEFRRISYLNFLDSALKGKRYSEADNAMEEIMNDFPEDDPIHKEANTLNRYYRNIRQ